ncbi:MAG: hypothetical protein M3P27_00740 [Acidobacteriota bacterium]|nr:hypothetical protein [Acidobacteriota bacterium]
MKTLRLLALALSLAAGFSLAAQDMHKPIPNAAFDRLKTLAGSWEGKYTGPEGSFTGAASFKVVSGGSAIMLSMDEGTGGEMITMFHPDGQKQLMATHYCAGQNQPRMKLNSISDPNVLVFDFVDGTNVSDPKADHMTKLVIRIVDADHHTEEWTSEASGKLTTAKFVYTRVKS